MILFKIIFLIILKVSAPPSFIQSLGPYTGFTAASTNVSLLCQVCHDNRHGHGDEDQGDDEEHDHLNHRTLTEP